MTDRTRMPSRNGSGRSSATQRMRAGWLCLLMMISFAVGVPGAFAEPSQASATGSAVVNVNTASPEELQALPGIGESRAQAIVELRKQQGGFKSLDDLAQVKGIGEATLEKLKPQMRLSGKTTLPQP